MTLAATDGEFWTPEEGAPGGVAFQVKVASKTRPDLTYTIARDEQGVIYHVHACEYWRFGNKRMCSHVKRAIELAEQPELTFLADTRARWEAIGGALATGDDLYRFWVETQRACIEAREIRWTQMQVGKARQEWDAMTPEDQVDEAVASFDRGDPREVVR